MNRHDLEDRLRSDAERFEAKCPPQLRHRVAARIQEAGRGHARNPLAFPTLAGVVGALVVLVSVWVIRDPAGLEQRSGEVVRSDASPVVAASDHLLASHEAALENEWQLLERDLRNLRDHVTSPFERNPNS